MPFRNFLRPYLIAFSMLATCSFILNGDAQAGFFDSFNWLLKDRNPILTAPLSFDSTGARLSEKFTVREDCSYTVLIVVPADSDYWLRLDADTLDKAIKQEKVVKWIKKFPANVEARFDRNENGHQSHIGTFSINEPSRHMRSIDSNQSLFHIGYIPLVKGEYTVNVNITSLSPIVSGIATELVIGFGHKANCSAE